jgi:hypothetical protein
MCDDPTCWILEDACTKFLEFIYENGNKVMITHQLYLSFIKYIIQEELELNNDIMIDYIINEDGEIDEDFKEMVDILLDARPERLKVIRWDSRE